MQAAQVAFYRTSVGKKVMMAVSGFLVFGFLLAHMFGNLQIFAGPEKINAYAAFLGSLGAGLWVFRVVMVVAISVHIVSAIQVTLLSFDARPRRYAVQKYRETTYAARTMWWGGPLIALFVVYHLMHLTAGSVHPEFTPNVYNNIVLGFQVPWVSGVYAATMLLIGLHLYHGLWSMLQTLGVAHPEWNRWRRVFAVAFALTVTLGNLSIPAAVMLGVVRPV
jgi:succinate dehydrogenase / fumarate reductase, cytochrome b subunit